MNYQEVESYLEAVPRFVKKNTMEQTVAFYRYLGSPGSQSKVIHVAGTNGKGSVCCYMGNILQAAGYRVGTFTSPHLVSMQERMCMGQGTEPASQVSEQEFTELFCQVKHEIEQYQQEKVSTYHPSYFEYLYFMAMLYFAHHKPDFILLETGLGGRLDATNSFPTPVLSMITRIGLDHTEYLGNTIVQIANEKAGIIKPGADVVYLADQEEVVECVENGVRNAKVTAYPVKPRDTILQKVHDKGIDFSFHTRYYKNDVFCLSTKALYQMENAALCIQAAVVLEQNELAMIPVEAVKKGLAKAHWAGRMEEIRPGVYLDGAHNADGIRAFLKTVEKIPCKGKRVLLFSVVSDKDYETMAGQLLRAEVFDKVLLAPLESSRRADMAVIAKLFMPGKVELYESVEQAYRSAVLKKEREDHLYIAGSLYLVGQIKARE